jgi:hypothetical protein
MTHIIKIHPSIFRVSPFYRAKSLLDVTKRDDILLVQDGFSTGIY